MPNTKAAFGISGKSWKDWGGSKASMPSSTSAGPPTTWMWYGPTASLVEWNPDAIVATGGRVVPILMQLTRSIPIIIPTAFDPVGTGWVKSLARPGGNVTGFTVFELSIVGKMLEDFEAGRARHCARWTDI